MPLLDLTYQSLGISARRKGLQTRRVFQKGVETGLRWGAQHFVVEKLHASFGLAAGQSIEFSLAFYLLKMASGICSVFGDVQTDLSPKYFYSLTTGRELATQSVVDVLFSGMATQHAGLHRGALCDSPCYQAGGLLSRPQDTGVLYWAPLHAKGCVEG